MADKAWKAYERRSANRWGTVRIGPTGDDGADFVSEFLYVQCKLRKSIPLWLLEAIDNAVNAAKGTEKKGVALVKKLNMRDDDSIVLMRLKDFEEFYELRKDDSDE